MDNYTTWTPTRRPPERVGGFLSVPFHEIFKITRLSFTFDRPARPFALNESPAVSNNINISKESFCFLHIRCVMLVPFPSIPFHAILNTSKPLHVF